MKVVYYTLREQKKSKKGRRKMKYSLLLVAFSVFGLASIQCAGSEQMNPLEEYLEAFSSFEQCVVAYSGRFAETQESPNDIASAAISTCSKEESVFYVAIIKLRRELPEMDEPEVVLEKFKSSLRNSATKTVLEKRNPNVQKQAP